MRARIRNKDALSAVQHRRRRSVAIGLAIVMAVALCTATTWPDGAVRALIESVGLVLIAMAVVGRAWCSLYIGGRKAEELVTTGPYSISRNPLYLFSFVGTLGVGFQSGGVTLGLVFLFATMAIFLPLIAREESYLAHAMAGAFEAYRKTTPRLWPRPDLWCSPPEISVRPDLFIRTLLDGVPFILAWPLFEGLDLLQRSGLLPVLWRWP